MDTPILDFAARYAASGALRLHMPGHKGQGPLGAEALDITEIPGADSLYQAQGIIRRSEENTGALFGAHTFFSGEGSSLCVRAMVALARQHALAQGRPPLMLAGRNAHSAFLSAAALLDVQVDWIDPPPGGSYLSCSLDGPALEARLAAMDPPPAALYLTSPDYLGHTLPLDSIAQVCRRHGLLLLVDNAHGAYLKFLPKSRHPMDLGAHMCCDSAHKTLPALTGGAYLHIARHAPEGLAAGARQALALFGSTSPSYLILQSLDHVNRYLSQDYPARLAAFLPQVQAARQALAGQGWALEGDEPLKITLSAKPRGWLGHQAAQALAAQGVVCEFADPDFLVFMLTPETGPAGLNRLVQALGKLPRRPPILTRPPSFRRPCRALSPRQAVLSPQRLLPAAQSLGRVLAAPSVGCPPAVPILMCGEIVHQTALDCFAYYGIQRCWVVDG